MSGGYTLDLTKAPRDALRETAEGILDEGVALMRVRGDREQAVHEVRKLLKKQRALLRLVRKQIDADVYRRENARYRDIGRELAAVRDARVRGETLHKLRRRFAGLLREDAFCGLEAELSGRQRASLEALGQDSWLRLRTQLEAARACIPQWLPEAEGFEAYRDSLARVYKRGRGALDRAADEPGAENFHELRKRVKYLRYQMRFLEALFPKEVRGYAKELHEMSKLLGEDHDLAALLEWLRRRDWPGLSGARKELLEAMIAHRQRGLRRRALAIGARAYSEKPARFADRLCGYAGARRREAG